MGVVAYKLAAEGKSKSLSFVIIRLLEAGVSSLTVASSLIVQWCAIQQQKVAAVCVGVTVRCASTIASFMTIIMTT